MVEQQGSGEKRGSEKGRQVGSGAKCRWDRGLQDHEVVGSETVGHGVSDTVGRSGQCGSEA